MVVRQAPPCAFCYKFAIRTLAKECVQTSVQLAVVVITPWGKGCPWGWTAAGWGMYCTPIAAGATELPTMPPRLVLVVLRPPLLVFVLFSMYLIRSAVEQVAASPSPVTMTQPPGMYDMYVHRLLQHMQDSCLLVM